MGGGAQVSDKGPSWSSCFIYIRQSCWPVATEGLPFNAGFLKLWKIGTLQKHISLVFITEASNREPYNVFVKK